MALPIGSTLGPYEIVELLGRGGMGEVYRARDPKLRRDVAIKILPVSPADDRDRLRRFEREAQTLASLNHPNIGAIYGIEERDGAIALVLELVEGTTLDAHLNRRPLSVEEATEIARQICTGLDAAHERGIVHRDLKPGNIKLTPAGVVKVLDFGLAKAAPGESGDLTQSPTAAADTMAGVLLGTAPYMSPEQARGRPLDKRTDIWSFGCVLYEMLTGHGPFSRDTVSDTIAAILSQEPDWTALPAAIPIHVRRVLQRCLEKDPRQRMRDIADARANLEESSAPPGSTVAATTFAGRIWPWIGGAAGALILLAIGLTVGRRQRMDATWQNPLAGAAFTRLTDFEGAEHDAALSPDGKFVAFRADRDGPFDVWLGQIGSGRFVNLTHGTDDERRTRTGSVGFTGDGSELWLGGGPDRRLRLMPLLGGAPRVFLGEGVVNVEWSADSTRIVYHTSAGGVDPIFMADRSGANAKPIFAGPYAGWHNHFPTWSHDGRWIYFVSGLYAANQMDLWRIPVGGGTPERLTQHNSDVAYPTPIDDQTVLYVARDRDGSGPWLWAFDIAGKVARRASFGLEQYISVAASGDGHRLVATVANPSSSLWRVPILDREVREDDVTPYAVPTVNPVAPRFGANALFYLSAGGTGSGLWRYQNQEAAEIWKAADGALLEPPAVSPDGRRLAIVLRRSGKLRLYLRSGDGAELQSVAESIEVQGSSCWSPDGKWIVTGARDASGEGLFKIPLDGGSPVRLVAGPALNPVWSPDSGVIVYAGPEVGGLSPLLAVHPDGSPLDMPVIRVRAGDGERARFLPHRPALVYMQGALPPQDFWLLDLDTKKSRQLTRLTGRAAMRTFDITPDGRHIVFDRLRENSDIVLIDLPRSSR